jgi:hypothetical protein
VFYAVPIKHIVEITGIMKVVVHFYKQMQFRINKNSFYRLEVVDIRNIKLLGVKLTRYLSFIKLYICYGNVLSIICSFWF